MLSYAKKKERFRHVQDFKRHHTGAHKRLDWGRQAMNTYQIVYKKASSVEHFGYHREIEGLVEAKDRKCAILCAKSLLEHTKRYAEMKKNGFDLVAQGELTPIDVVLRLRSGAEYLIREITDSE